MYHEVHSSFTRILCFSPKRNTGLSKWPLMRLFNVINNSAEKFFTRRNFGVTDLTGNKVPTKIIFFNNYFTQVLFSESKFSALCTTKKYFYNSFVQLTVLSYNTGKSVMPSLMIYGQQNSFPKACHTADELKKLTIRHMDPLPVT